MCVLPLCFLIFNVGFRKLSQQWLECAEFFLFVIFDFFKFLPTSLLFVVAAFVMMERLHTLGCSAHRLGICLLGIIVD